MIFRIFLNYKNNVMSSTVTANVAIYELVQNMLFIYHILAFNDKPGLHWLASYKFQIIKLAMGSNPSMAKLF